VIFAIFCSLFFTSSSLMMKYLTGPFRGFDSFKLSFSSYFIVGTILSGMLLNYGLQNPESFEWDMLWLGLFGSVVNTIGIVIIGKAFSTGPLGPVSALSCLQSILFSIAQCFALGLFPKPLELVGTFIGILGALILTIPEKMHALASKVFPCLQNKEETEPKYTIN
jgi:drug/metabolite transporter (DMT)-like permease